MENTTTMTRMSARVGRTYAAADHFALSVLPTAAGRTLPIAGRVACLPVVTGGIVPSARFVAKNLTPTNVHRSAPGSPPV